MNVSLPNKQQLVHGMERTAVVFVLAAASYLKLTSDPFTTAAWSAAGWAGVTAVYQFVLSTFTDL